MGHLCTIYMSGTGIGVPKNTVSSYPLHGVPYCVSRYKVHVRHLRQGISISNGYVDRPNPLACTELVVPAADLG